MRSLATATAALAYVALASIAIGFSDASFHKSVCPPYMDLQIHDEFIVTFTKYDNLRNLESSLDVLVASYPVPLSSSSSLHRRAIKINHDVPTDFVVWTLFDWSPLSVIHWLGLQPGVKSIVRNRRLHLTSLNTQPASPQEDDTMPTSATWNYMEAWDMAQLRAQNITGHGVKVAIFDTGLDPDSARRHFRHVDDIINWTDEPVLRDSDGHGSFVAGVVGSVHRACPGIAPDASLVSFRVFTTSSASYTSWLLDALNYAMYLGVDVLNFSFGGPDFHDAPFMDKIHECAASGIVVMSAVGNGGPQYGTLTNPADQIDVFGIGGLGSTPSTIAPFSARGQSLWEIATGYGRVKPDAVAPATFVKGLYPGGDKCRMMNGTSMAAPLATGMVALVLSQIPSIERKRFGHVGFVKGVFLQTARRLPSIWNATMRSTEAGNTWQHIYEQGAGSLDVNAALAALPLAMAAPTAVLLPSSLNLTDCPYMWPHCLQPLYHTRLPLTINITMFHPTALTSQLVGAPKWTPSSADSDILSIQTFPGSEMFWPYSGAIGVHIRVTRPVLRRMTVSGRLTLFISDSPPVELYIEVPVIPAPPPRQRVLWDQYRNLQYPSGYIPRDNLHQHTDPFDTQGDHAHTNFGDFFHRLVVQHKLYVEVLTTDYSCVDDLSVYGLLLVVDPEEPWFPTEVALVHAAMRSSDLSVFVIADWYSPTVLTSMSFWDANTLSTWLPVTGGANIPAINTLLAAFRIRLSHRAWSNPGIMYLSGSAIVDLPDLGFVMWANLTQDSTGPTGLSPRRIASFESVKSANNAAVPPNDSQKMAVAALVPLQGANAGRVVVYGDSSCVDSSIAASSDAKATCEGWIDGLIEYALRGKLPEGVEAVNNLHVREDVDHDAADIRAQTLLAKYSKVLGHAPACPNVAFG
ncbi:hypothetical protein H310_12437 [Aphanomyces invadans]|uniref:subtilisin n=1 Tax=Aphanomyces invadans TaxID=157072 RepID=A0A024THM8_9STRA|nr:hypothetical protein H310_12437 [Aphanomyces invadans]ETV93670.1 hypothetical protein H310_12437 [Aphanomyces invadans]|eukprot:XP_008877711.1 hypothetical protein H310_12437 [Aphanomyces invadans]